MLVLLNIGSFTYAMQSAKEVNRLNTVVSSLPTEPIVYVGKDGQTPKLGIDYFLPQNGKDGVNSISFSNTVKETVVKEVPIIGPAGQDGINGKDGVAGAEFMMRVNDSTGDLEAKYSNEKYWQTMVPCNELKVSCHAN